MLLRNGTEYGCNCKFYGGCKHLCRECLVNWNAAWWKYVLSINKQNGV